jgi:hypothetical protein
MILKNNLVIFIRERFNFDEFKFVGAHEKHAVATMNLRTTSAFS